MRIKAMAVPFLAAFIALAGVPIRAQVAPSASGGNGWPLVTGAGFSDFSLDWNPDDRMEGVTVWAGWNFRHLPSRLDGIGLELEGRDLNLGRPSNLTKMRQDTALGGPIYTWKRYERLHPYGKWLMGLGSIDFPDTINPIIPTTREPSLLPAEGWTTVWATTSLCAPTTNISSGASSSAPTTSIPAASPLAQRTASAALATRVFSAEAFKG